MTLDLLAVLGPHVPVVEHPGWRTRARPGLFAPRAVMVHHDASAVGSSPELARYIAEIGRPPDTPAPLSQLWVCLGCRGQHPIGSWHLLAAGRANHAGVGGPWGTIPRDGGNTYAYGVETDHTTGEPVDPELWRSLVVGCAVLLRALGASPTNALPGHKDYAPGRKTDPDWSMDVMRQAVRTYTPSTLEVDDMAAVPQAEWDAVKAQIGALSYALVPEDGPNSQGEVIKRLRDVSGMSLALSQRDPAQIAAAITAAIPDDLARQVVQMLGDKLKGDAA